MCDLHIPGGTCTIGIGITSTRTTCTVLYTHTYRTLQFILLSRNNNFLKKKYIIYFTFVFSVCTALLHVVGTGGMCSIFLF